ncbi:hypothetical protein M758_9G038900 [Ceratodon purpureus]|nr:hypothetical protein M758_9G038900 [Ceratodon purpureus]
MPPHVMQSPSCGAEYWGKQTQDKVKYFDGVIIVGAGPSGLATAACLQAQGVRVLILEKAACIASLWQLKTYDRLHLHLPKQFCELPLFPFPADFPTYPARDQFVNYLQEYSSHFGLRPLFNHAVNQAEFDSRSGLWHVKTTAGCSVREFRARWLVVASGENAEPVVPVFKGVNEFEGKVFHSSAYRNGVAFEGKKVLVVGCGNTGMEIALDLANFGASPTLVVRSPTHILPREICGKSTFLVAMMLMKNLPVWLTDRLLVGYTYLTLGDTAKVGIPRPSEGPMLMKERTGKTPILDVGTFAAIKSGQVKVRPAVESLTPTGAQFEDGRREDFDAIILATGYRSNVPKWLKDDSKFFSEEGLPRQPFPHGWKGESGLYVAGLGRKGLLGASKDARSIALDIAAEISIADIPSLRLVPCQHEQHEQQQQQQRLLAD